jgi:transposase-like protein
MGRARGRTFWESLVAEVRAGDAPIEVARRHGVSPSGLGYWVRQLPPPKTRAQEPRLLPVRVAAAALSRRSLRLVVGEAHLEFEEGTDPAYVAALAEALRAC